MSSTNKFIGAGIIFPIEIDSNGRTKIVNDISLINTSISNIINWPKRHRFFNEAYGCRIEELLEEPDDSVSRSLLKHFIVESISTWEKRVEISSSGISILDSIPGAINISVTYRLRSTKIEETFIFPFYKEIKY